MDEAVTTQVCDKARHVLRTSDLNWLLHRAAHRMGELLEAAAARHGVGMRGQLVLSALRAEQGRTQLALGAALGLDKTTLTTVLDKLEGAGYVRRQPDPQDRRVRIPTITEAGVKLQQLVDHDVHLVEEELLTALDAEQRQILTDGLRRLIDADVHSACVRSAGSCM
jgi:MarR family transcriptional regulator, organic hydroperoxide resistance regulator